MEYRKFQESKRDIYPTITFCIWNGRFEDKLGLYDREKLNKKYGIKEPGEYISFLKGHIWEDKMIEVDFDDVTLEIKDRIESIKIIGNKWQELYTWDMNDENRNESAESSSKFPQSPFYTSYRHADGKCFSLDLAPEKMPNIRGQQINIVWIKFKNIRIPGINLEYMISYPGQILQGFTLDIESSWSQSITTGYLKGKNFFIDIVEVFRRRNTFLRKSCNKHWEKYDETVFSNIIKTANCKPPHWNISTDYPICNRKEKMKKVYIPLSPFKPASPKFLEKFLRPCDRIQAATFNTVSERRQLTWGGSISTDGVNSADVGFHFKNDRYKEIRYTRAFDIESLIGNVGGYIGLFLGFAIWQIPEAIEFLKIKLQTLQGGNKNLIIT